MKLIRKFYYKWYVQLFLVLLTVTMGCIGYYNYYSDQESTMIPAAFLIQIFMSTIKLFTFAFDVDNSLFMKGVYPGNQKEWVLWMLQAARILALILTGTTLFKVLSSHLSRLNSQFNYFLWGLLPEKQC